MLPEFFNSHFIKLGNVHKHYTRQKHRNKYYQVYTSESEKKNSSSYLFESAVHHYLFESAEKYSKEVSSLFIFSI